MIKTDKSSTPEPMSMPSARKRWVKRLVFWGKIFVTLLVLGWISYRLYSDWTEISRYHWKLHYCWLIGAGGFYLTAFFAAAVFWYLSLRWLGQIPTFFQAVRSYYVSQLGKYIPGKAMVVV
ncbi:MAG: hypothetical protein IKW74_08260, partial [Thermoguttaceae bacterium]|nr:hypothetical protein [Thermoguttaceae bacterium]